MTVDLYVWHAPRDLDAEGAAALIAAWQASGGDPAASPFEPSTDVGWFHRELRQDEPSLVLGSDAVPSTSTTPIWLSGSDEPPARVVAIGLSGAAAGEALETIYGLAAKYDLVVFDAHNGRLHRPLAELAAHASATFWPGGAIRSAFAGGIGAAILAVGWSLGIPLLSGVVMVVGGFMVVLAVATFVHEGRVAWRARGRGGESPPSP